MAKIWSPESIWKPMAQGLGVSEAESSGRSKASRDNNGGVSLCCSQRGSNSNLSARRQ